MTRPKCCGIQMVAAGGTYDNPTGFVCLKCGAEKAAIGTEKPVRVQTSTSRPESPKLSTEVKSAYLRDLFMEHWDGPEPLFEYVFASPRKWALDVAFPLNGKVAIELEGSFHRTQQRFHSDVEKYNRLSSDGWTLFRCTRRMLVDPEKRGEFYAMVKKKFG